MWTGPYLNQFKFLENCLPTPPLTQHFAPSEKQVLMLTEGGVGGQFPKLIQNVP